MPTNFFNLDFIRSKIAGLAVIAALLISGFIITVVYAAPQTIVPGADWFDTNNSLIEAHGGDIIQIGNTYYWIGQDRSHNNNSFKGINCYSSTDLVTWTFENTILSPEASPSPLTSDKIVARPKLIYNSANNNYVMWFKYRDPNGPAPNMKAGVATSPTVCGNYTLQNIFFPTVNNVKHYAGDNQLFLDDDGTGYYIISSVGEVGPGGEGTYANGSGNNRHLKIFKLNNSFTNVIDLVYEFPVESVKRERREGPAIAKMNGTYFIIASGTTGWTPNQSRYSSASSMTGPWSSWQDIGDNVTYDSQPMAIITVSGSNATTYIYAGDRHVGSNLIDSRYVWLPLTANGTTLTMDWYDAWSIDTVTGEWNVPVGPTTYEAEDAINTLTGTAKTVSCSTASGGVTVNKLGSGGSNNGTLQFNNVNVPTAGTYHLTISYISKYNRSANIRINGNAPQTVNFPSSGNWCYKGGSPSDLTISITLNAGNNTILFDNPSANAPVIDKIVVEQ